MSTINLNPETIAAYKELITNPEKHGLGIDSISVCFEKNHTND